MPLITIYGINNIGKTTHAKNIVKRLKKSGKKAIYVKYPIYDLKPTGPFINKILRSKNSQKISEEELQMWYVLNRYQFEPTLKKYLKQNYIVIAEDYIGTGLAWGWTKGANLKWLENLNKHLLKENFAIFLDGQRTLIAKEQKHIHEQNDDLINKCTAKYRLLAKKYHWQTINAGSEKDSEKTQEMIWKCVKKISFLF
ncbi:MAG: hypothetical protein UR28_C0044G0002 [Candidatus Peregrinibacteria bacterium GW2011_GWF2_33_10]|nr:MAG: hypothetical protein UR28_C0044G0002 [Candidatus Peregrinibacteria bacterium GW2011_GWF2_33_10]OGJ44056.1 MAG: hypothetical protein A2263_01470 [Candidatus Peregrinibacteria bacterium RIFOXYA2_FULL_33_21]OGJ45701.1 MAG: hypothetical protein A2272_03765 [Candidatus Peregrinibacteria bacterium RIFOXYA12_FULL_33_12]OGJ51419.1 MAG: hypothetical protein A2307_02635 [Candidatus Peregrinibacteria bacterium RIFOXYB2_FULL_33_20]